METNNSSRCLSFEAATRVFGDTVMSQTSSAVGVVGLTPPPAFLAVPGALYQAWSAWKKSFLAFLGATGLDTVSATRKK